MRNKINFKMFNRDELSLALSTLDKNKDTNILVDEIGKLYYYDDKFYVAFWNGIFSQWYHSPFQVYSTNYKNAEQYMMHMKAKLFNDEEIAEQIISKSNPKIIKALGRKIRNFNEEIWNEEKVGIVKTGNFHKFKQNQKLLDDAKLLWERKPTFVEGSPFDKIWGVGIHFNDDEINNPDNWQGENLLGVALNEAFSMLDQMGMMN